MDSCVGWISFFDPTQLQFSQRIGWIEPKQTPKISITIGKSVSSGALCFLPPPLHRSNKAATRHYKECFKVGRLPCSTPFVSPHPGRPMAGLRRRQGSVTRPAMNSVGGATYGAAPDQSGLVPLMGRRFACGPASLSPGQVSPDGGRGKVW